MERVEVYRCPEFRFPVVYAAKFKHVKNGGAIRARIIKAATMGGTEGEEERDAVSFAFINARLITSPLHLQTAAVQALFAESAQTMRTRTVHSEIIWHLDPTNNITEALRRYGVSEGTTDVVVMHVASWEREDVLARMRAVVDGELDVLGRVGDETDWGTVMQASRVVGGLHHRLDGEPAFRGFSARAEERARVDNAVVSAVASKSIL